jgi:hypothetical protein
VVAEQLSIERLREVLSELRQRRNLATSAEEADSLDRTIALIQRRMTNFQEPEGQVPIGPSRPDDPPLEQVPIGPSHPEDDPPIAQVPLGGLDPNRRRIVHRDDGILVDADTGEEVRKGDVQPDDEVIEESSLGGGGATEPTAVLDIPRSPELGIDRGDVGLKLLEVLGGLGGGIARSRAVGQANKANLEGQASANLINALSSGGGARAAQVRPELGIGGNILDALGSIGEAGGELRTQAKGFEQKNFENLLDEIGAETAQTVSLAKLERERRLSTGGQRTSAGKDRAAKVIGVDVHAEGKTRDQVRAAVEAVFADDPDVEILVSMAESTWDKRDVATDTAAFDRSIKETREDRAESAEERAKAAERRRILVPHMTTAGQSVEDRVVATGLQSGRVVGISDIFEEELTKIGQALGADLTSTEMKQISNFLSAAYQRGRRELITTLRKEGPPASARMAIGEIEAMVGKVSQLEKMLAESRLLGPIFGRVPSFQLIDMPASVFDDFSSAFGLELASVLNRGRPSDKDFELAARIVPKRYDREDVRARKLQAIRDMLALRAQHIEMEFPPVLTIEGDEDSGFTVVIDDSRRPERVETPPGETPPPEGKSKGLAERFKGSKSGE